MTEAEIREFTPIVGSLRWKIKEDSRPQLGWYAPGDYMCRCSSCKDYYAGDKRSVICADCAYKQKEEG